MPGTRVPHRDVGPFIAFFRDIFRGRPFTPSGLRFADELAARTQPAPKLPGGPYCKTSKIYYHARDARQEVKPPMILVKDRLPSGASEAQPEEQRPNNKPLIRKIYQPK